MPDATQRLSALASAYRHGRHGAHEGSAGLRIVERRLASIVQVAAFGADSATASGLSFAAATNRSARRGSDSVLWAGPLRWLVLNETEADLTRRLATAIGGTAAVTDLSHARTVLRLSGAKVRDVLAKGCGVDFHARVFPVGGCAVSAIGKIGAHIHAVDEAPSFDVMVYRGYGHSFREWLIESAVEFGYAVPSASHVGRCDQAH